MTRPMLEIVDLSKSFPVRNAFGRAIGEVRAVDRVSLKIERGRVYGLAGESGSGKSTIARVIMGLTPPTAGDIVIDGESVVRRGGRRGAKSQMVFQNPGSSLNPRRTVGQSLAVPLAAHGHPRGDRQRRIGELLEMVQLPADFAQRFPHELSGGQKQRVAIARALAPEPHVLLADEPTSALDPRTTQSLLEVLADVNRRLGVTILLVSHEMGVIRRLCHRVSVMEAGQIVERLTIANGRIPPDSQLAQWLREYGDAEGDAEEAAADPAPQHLLSEAAHG